MMRGAWRGPALLALGAAALMAGGCARADRCYVDDLRYQRMRTLFEQTGSYQRVADAMRDESWALCEQNQFRYQLTQDLFLKPEDLAVVPPGSDPETFGGPLPHNHDMQAVRR